MISLSQLSVGQKAKIVYFEMNEKIFIRFMEMGLCVNEKIQMLGRLPFGGNLVILSKNGKYTLREREARLIKMGEIDSDADSH